MNEGAALIAAFEEMFGFTPQPKPWDAVAEERMAAAAEGRSLRPVAAPRAQEHTWRRGKRDEAGYVSDGTRWRWEPTE